MPTTPNGTLIQKTARQSIAASRPPATRPRNWPASAVIWLTPRAMPRWCAGNASVRIAAEFAISIAPPVAWTTRHRISHSAPARAWNGSSDSATEATLKTSEAEVVHPDAAEHVAEPTERDDEDGRDQQVAEDHPQQVADVGRGQRVETDAAEDGRHRNDHDRDVERRDQHAERRVRQGHPLVPIRPAGSHGAAVTASPPDVRAAVSRRPAAAARPA